MARSDDLDLRLTRVAWLSEEGEHDAATALLLPQSTWRNEEAQTSIMVRLGITSRRTAG